MVATHEALPWLVTFNVKIIPWTKWNENVFSPFECDEHWKMDQTMKMNENGILNFLWKIFVLFERWYLTVRNDAIPLHMYFTSQVYQSFGIFFMHSLKIREMQCSVTVSQNRSVGEWSLFHIIFNLISFRFQYIEYWPRSGFLLSAPNVCNVQFRLQFPLLGRA